MKKKSISLYYIIFLLILQVFVGCGPVMALSETQKAAISEHCEAISDNLKDVQKMDSRVRVYLGRYYETILTKFIIPLNLRLVENNLSGADLIENQNDFNTTRASFMSDYIEYQKSLEELVALDCKAEPENFYQKLTLVREKRGVVAEDVAKLQGLMAEQITLVKGLKAKL